MRSSFFSRPPRRLIWNTENFTSVTQCAARPWCRKVARPQCGAVAQTNCIAAPAVPPPALRWRRSAGARERACSDSKGVASLRFGSDAGGFTHLLHVLLGIGDERVELQPHLFRHGELGVTALALARELLLQRKHRL